MESVKLSYEESHKEIDKTIYKLCNICNEWLPCNEEYFYKNKSNLTDGLFPSCKKCNKIKANDRVAKNRDENKKKCKEWYEKNHEYRLKGINKYNQDNKGKRRKYFKTYIKTDHGKQIMSKHNKFRSMNKKHEITQDEWIQCKEYFNNQCAYCGMTELEHKELYNQQLHKEHIDANGSNGIGNCVPSCRSCNSKKRTKLFSDWYNEENPFFSIERLNKINTWVENH